MLPWTMNICQSQVVLTTLSVIDIVLSIVKQIGASIIFQNRPLLHTLPNQLSTDLKHFHDDDNSSRVSLFPFIVSEGINDATDASSYLMHERTYASQNPCRTLNLQNEHTQLLHTAHTASAGVLYFIHPWIYRLAKCCLEIKLCITPSYRC